MCSSKPGDSRQGRGNTDAEELCGIAGWVTFVVQAQHGLGRHSDIISVEDTLINREALFFQSILVSNWAMCLVKVSIALNLLRFSNGTRWYFWSLWLIIGN